MFQPHSFSRLVYAVMVFSLLAFGVLAMAQASSPTNLLARLSGASVVPPNNSEATGNLQATLDKQTRVLSWTLSTIGLSGPVVGASFNGPAMPGDNAAVEVPLQAQNLERGAITLTPEQVDAVLAERWYISVVTAARPGGEIRGQLIVAAR
ncbi:MAG: CHRD domain-containing protein [Burkholderiaceae bacterium]|nr:CHRD domain-containing protein [Burkholderiaceae bacterium]